MNHESQTSGRIEGPDTPQTRRDLLRQAAAVTAAPILSGHASAQQAGASFGHMAGATGPEAASPPAKIAFPVETQPERPPRPWERYSRDPVPPGEPGVHYRPVFVPNGVTLPFRIIDGVKVFHLVAEEIVHTVAEGLTVHAWGYNGRTPGPVIEAVEGDRVRIYVTNRLPAPTSVHWHAMLVPNGMDGVAAVTQPAIQPGETFKYEFIIPKARTFMYHPHFDNMTQEGMGLAGMFVVHPRNSQEPSPDRDFVIILHEEFIDGGTFRPDPFEMSDFNILTMNGKVLPATYPLVCQLGDRVRIRIGNLSQMNHHPIHLHGFEFRITATDGGPIPREGQWPETTVLVGVGQTRDIEFLADNPGDWVMHCHMTHHTMNQMGHDFISTVGVDDSEVEKKIKQLIPGYMTMGKNGMAGMATMDMPIPPNTIPMLGLKGQFGQLIFGGMATVVKVREHAPTYEDPGWYAHPPGTVASAVSLEEFKRLELDTQT